MTCKLLLVCGSLRNGSVNAAVLRTAKDIAAPDVIATSYARMHELPHFNPDDDREPLPEPVAHLRKQLAEQDAVLFCTPEYAGALPGAFKNLLDWTVGEGIYEKPVGFINASAMGGAKGTHEQLRVVLAYTNTDIVEDACAEIPVARSQIGADGMIADEATRHAIAKVVSALTAHADSLEGMARQLIVAGPSSS